MKMHFIDARDVLPIRAFIATAASVMLLCLSACGGGDNPESTSPAAGTPATPSAAAPTVRNTQLGAIVGLDDTAATGTYAWKGVPYAKPPTGDLRWKAPADLDPWTAPKATQAFGNACAQIERIVGPGANNRYDQTVGTTLGQPVGNEDCLYLNIWRPATGDSQLPVIVFIHGGAFTAGYTADPMYDGATLARTANAVVVTVNYRLGILGFLNLPQLKGGVDAIEDSGNFAMLDIRKALQFVNTNIASFGGNPANVTLMGQSAGAMLVYAMMTSPLVAQASPKLFHRAVPMSGGISLASDLPAGSMPAINTAATALAQANGLLEQQLIVDGFATDKASADAYAASQTPAQIAAYLRARSAASLLTTWVTKLVPVGMANSGPIPDGTVLPADPVAAIRAGQYNQVPVWASNTSEEFKSLSPYFSVSLGQIFSTIFTYNPDAAPTLTIGQWIPAQYLPVNTPTTGYNAVIAQLDQRMWLANRDSVLSALSSQQSNIWYSRFDWAQEPAPFNDIFGAAHAFDLPFAFGNFGPSLFANATNSSANRLGRLDLSGAMMQSLAAFARTGDPNASALGVTWPAYPSTLVFDATQTQKAISVLP